MSLLGQPQPSLPRTPAHPDVPYAPNDDQRIVAPSLSRRARSEHCEMTHDGSLSANYGHPAQSHFLESRHRADETLWGPRGEVAVRPTLVSARRSRQAARATRSFYSGRPAFRIAAGQLFTISGAANALKKVINGSIRKVGSSSSSRREIGFVASMRPAIPRAAACKA
jgi:hypothetical protein